MKKSFYLLILVTFVILFGINNFDAVNAESETLETRKIMGYDGNSKITIEFTNDEIISYSLSIDDYIVESTSSKFKFKENKFYIIDREHGNFIFAKNIDDKKWVVISKINIDSKLNTDSKINLKWVIDIDTLKKITGQRDLFEESNNKMLTQEAENSVKKSQSLEKYEKIEKAKKIYAEQLKNLESANKQGETKVTLDYNKYKEYQKSNYNRNDATTPKPTIEIKDKSSMKLFLSVPNHVTWKHNLVYDVLVTDDSKQTFKSNLKSFVGNAIKDATVSSIIKSPDGTVLHESNCNTDSNGLCKNSFLIPDRSTTRGKYVLEVTATKSINDVMLKVTSKKQFFVNAISDDSFNDPPVAIISLADVTMSINSSTDSPIFDAIIYLNASESYDVDDTNLTYMWKLLKIVEKTLKGNNPNLNNNYSNLQNDVSNLVGKEPKISVNVGVNVANTFEFELIVSDGNKNSLPVSTNVILYGHKDIIMVTNNTMVTHTEIRP